MNNKDKVIDYFKKIGKYNKYKKDGSLDTRIKNGIKMIEDKERHKQWKKTKSTDTWKETKSKMAKYNDFIKEAERRLGKKLVITTGGSKWNHGEYGGGALDISMKGNTLTREQYNMLGKLALDFGYRVGDESDHLHVDDSIRRGEDRAKKDTINWYKKNKPEVLEKHGEHSELINTQIQKAVKERKKSKYRYSADKQEQKKYIPSKKIVYNVKHDPVPGARQERKELGTFEKYEQKKEDFQQTYNKNMQDIMNKVKNKNTQETSTLLDSGSTGLSKKLFNIDNKIDEEKRLKLEVVKRQLRR